jgi:hypothetical protein
MAVLAAEPASDAHLEFLARRDLSTADWLEAFGDLALRAYNLEWRSLPVDRLRDLGDEGASWAPAYADRLLYLFSGDDPFQYHHERAWWNTYPAQALWLVFLALARARIPIEPRWDVLLPAARKPPRDQLIECVRAIPEERRPAAIARSLGRYVPDEVVDLVLSLLEIVPSAALADELLARAERHDAKTRRRMLTSLAQIGKSHPRIQASVDRFHCGAPASRPLHAVVLRKPTAPDQLAAIQQQQLLVAGKLYDGKDRPLAERIEAASDGRAVDGSFYGSLEFHQLATADGTPTYDVFLYRADSGAIFRAGSLEVVAEVIQGCLECDDGVVRDMLQKALGLA